jgi:hypothetical protein
VLNELLDRGGRDGEENFAVIGEPGGVERGTVVAVDPVELEQDSLVLDRGVEGAG